MKSWEKTSNSKKFDVSYERVTASNSNNSLLISSVIHLLCTDICWLQMSAFLAYSWSTRVTARIMLLNDLKTGQYGKENVLVLVMWRIGQSQYPTRAAV